MDKDTLTATVLQFFLSQRNRCCKKKRLKLDKIEFLEVKDFSQSFSFKTLLEKFLE